MRDPVLGQQIEDARKSRRLTQADAGQQFGVAQSTISQLEDGLLSAVGSETLQKILSAWKIERAVRPPIRVGRQSQRVGLCTNPACIASLPFRSGIRIGILPQACLLPADLKTPHCRICSDVMIDHCRNPDCGAAIPGVGAACPACGKRYVDVPELDELKAMRPALERELVDCHADIRAQLGASPVPYGVDLTLPANPSVARTLT